jgi:prenyl protein peptidase
MLYSREYLEGTVQTSRICLTTPLFFGLAHVHHAYTKIKHDKVPVSMALMSSGFQFIYTYLFGAYVSFCYMKTKSFMSVCLVHSLCNYLSLPNIAIFLVETRSRQNMRVYYAIVGLTYVVGIFLFYLGFHSLFALKNESQYESF